MFRRTKPDIIKEILLCGKDPKYFLKHYARIQHPIKGLIPFRTFGYQDDAIDGFLNHRLNIILKARQLGFTTLVAGFIAWFIIFNKDKNVLIVSTKVDVAKNTIRIIDNIIKYLPRELMLCKQITNNKQSIELNNGSRVKAITTSADAGRSEAVSLLFIDEVAHIEKMDELWTGIWPTISAGGRAILSSTPNGTSNFFYKTYKQAQNYENNFNCRFGLYSNPSNIHQTYNDRFMWWVHPDHDELWFAEETKGRSARDIAQEYECNFNASGATYLPANLLEQLQLSVSDPVERTFDDRNLWIWKPPEHLGTYLVSSDVSSGFAEDYSTIHVIRIDQRLEQCAEYKGKIPADNLGDLLMRVSKHYNNATIAPENNSGWSGQAVQRITDAKYPFLYWSPRRKGEFVDTYNTVELDEALPGYRVTQANRIAMLAKVEQYIRNNDIVLYSQRLVDEFREFIWKNGKPIAASGAHDDLIMALAGAIWIREESFMSSYRNCHMSEALINSIGKSNNPVNQHQSFNQYAPRGANTSTMMLPNGECIDLAKMLISMG